MLGLHGRWFWIIYHAAYMGCFCLGAIQTCLDIEINGRGKLQQTLH
jgi:hypothetical protein